MPKKNPPKKTIIKKKKPPKEPIKSGQMDLFSKFVKNNSNKLSNTIEIWDSIPKYFFTTKQMEKLRTPEGLAEPHTWTYKSNGTLCSVKIQPALIEQKNGNYKAYFPGVTEEIVEEALIKILSNQQYGIHNPQKAETWVRFTLRMIQKELISNGKTRSLKEIKQAIEVMSSCIITWQLLDTSHSSGAQEIWKGSILQDLLTVGKDEYLKDREAHHVARLPLFISNAINSLEYRQFNYIRLMGCKHQLTRWIYKRFINRYTYANWEKPYNFLYSDLKNSGLLQQEREADNRKKVISALKELIKQDVLMSYEVDERKKGATIIDIKYTFLASPNFTSEQKAANLRFSDNKKKGKKIGLDMDN